LAAFAPQTEHSAKQDGQQAFAEWADVLMQPLQQLVSQTEQAHRQPQQRLSSQIPQ
jgi:hypothetical protein